jgi:hypothetical protein
MARYILRDTGNATSQQILCEPSCLTMRLRDDVSAASNQVERNRRHVMIVVTAPLRI